MFRGICSNEFPFWCFALASARTMQRALRIMQRALPSGVAGYRSRPGTGPIYTTGVPESEDLRQLKFPAATSPSPCGPERRFETENRTKLWGCPPCKCQEFSGRPEVCSRIRGQDANCCGPARRLVGSEPALWRLVARGRAATRQSCCLGRHRDRDLCRRLHLDGQKVATKVSTAVATKADGAAIEGVRTRWVGSEQATATLRRGC
jgi:hypothetical protein